MHPEAGEELRVWCSEGPTRHFALGIGHHADELIHLGKLWGDETIVVTPGKFGKKGEHINTQKKISEEPK